MPSRRRITAAPNRRHPGRRPRGRRLGASGVRAALPLIVLVALGCDVGTAERRLPWSSGQATAMALPPVEFLIATDDSSYWIRTGPQAGPDGVEVLRAPLVLTVVEGRWQELYVTEQDFSFPSAVLTAQALWRRDLLSGDSLVVATDSVIPELALAYARAHPGELPLLPDEPADDDPATVASTEVWLYDVHGPYASVELYSDTHLPRGRVRHDIRRSVVELASGRGVALSELVDGGWDVATVLERRGRAELVATRDSARDLALQVDTAAAIALDSFMLDPANFALTQVGDGPGIVFYAVGTGPDDEVVALPTIPIPLGATPWWGVARAALPDSGAGTDDRAELSWRRGALSVRSRPDPVAAADSDMAGGAPLRPSTLTLGDSARGEWPIARLGSVPRRLYWLDAPGALGSEERRALRRAFYDAAFADDALRATSRRDHEKPTDGTSFRPVASPRIPSPPTSTR